VLVIDWDLDSPGLHRYFHPFVDSKLVAATPGVIELINDYAWAATVHEDHRATDWHRQYARILPHAASLNWKAFPDEGTLDYVSAGRQNRDYSSSLTAIDWDNFYDRLGGGQFIDALREDMKAHYDYTLIDSRTGLSDVADICTVHLPDILVDCFTLNYQSVEGRPPSPIARTSATTTAISARCPCLCESMRQKRTRRTPVLTWPGRSSVGSRRPWASTRGTTTGPRLRFRTSRTTASRRRYLWKRGEFDEALETAREIDRQWGAEDRP
jgi:hypothetical protein